jgi:S-DNA-T family DNA segregation ATPase FtsK/SpoIIIE
MTKANGALRHRAARASRRGTGTAWRRRLERWFAAALSPAGLAIAGFVLVLAILPYAQTLNVLDELRRDLVRATGLMCLLLPLDALALALTVALLPAVRRSLRFWRTVVGLQLLAGFLWGIFGTLRPQTTLANVPLDSVTLGGAIGHALVASALGMLLWLALLTGGFSLVWPRAARWLVQQIPPTARWLWRQRLPQRLWHMLHAFWQKGGPVAPPALPHIVADTPLPALEEEPTGETLGQGAAEAFRRGSGTKPARPARDTAPAAPRDGASTAPPAADEPSPPAPPSPWQWTLPGPQILNAAPAPRATVSDNEARARIIEETLASFHVDARVVQINQGPTVTQFGIEPGWEVKTRTEPERDANGKIVLDKDGRPKLRVEEVSRTRVQVRQITKLQNDLALALAAPSIRIEAPVPGKSIIGIEVPNTTAAIVTLRSVVESPQFQKLAARSKLALALGMGVSGEPVVADLARMPHLLIAGATGSGKSVCINAIIACILMHATPDEVRFVMIDPKRVEMAQYASIPHLALSRIITDMDEVPGVLQAVIYEMEDRYKKLEAVRVRNIEAYNRHPKIATKLPYWVVVIDELADLMMSVPFEVERQICQLAQKARAVGIHLIVATQRPSVDVITGLIKANFPTRIAFAVSSQVDSRTILDTVGAEKLLGRGDMLFQPTDEMKPRRLQGVWVSETEIERLVDFWCAERWEQLRPQTFDHLVEKAKEEQAQAEAPESDELLEKARALALEHTRISTSMLQRRLRIGYPRAARLMDALAEEGIVERGGNASREVIGGDAALYGEEAE